MRMTVAASNTNVDGFNRVPGRPGLLGPVAAAGCGTDFNVLASFTAGFPAFMLKLQRTVMHSERGKYVIRK